MARSSKGGAEKRLSPLYTSRSAELAKRTILQENGRDKDGAYRAYGRLDTPPKKA